MRAKLGKEAEMRTRVIVLAAGLALGASPALAQKKPTPAPVGITVGQVLDDTLGKTVNGWLHTSGSLYAKRETKDYVTTETMECCVAVFNRGNRFIVARTEAVTRNPTGGVIKERVLATHRLTARPGEVETDCSLIGQSAFLTLQDPKTGWLRSVVLSGDAFITVTWKDPGSFCSYGD